MVFPEPVISLAIEPKTKADQEKMAMALQKLGQEDPSLRISSDEETGQTIISGMGELHLEIIVDRMKREFKVEANVGKPQVAFRETIRSKVQSEGKYIRQTGGRGQYGHVWLEIEPLEPGKGFEFVNKVVGGAVPKEYVGPVEKGVFEAVTEARSAMLGAKGPADAAKADNMFTSAMKSIFAVAEAYPELKASDNFKELQAELTDTEDKIQASRRFYNGSVRDLNIKVKVFPTNIFANMLGFKVREFFEVADQAAIEEPVAVKF